MWTVIYHLLISCLTSTRLCIMNKVPKVSVHFWNSGLIEMSHQKTNKLYFKDIDILEIIGTRVTHWKLRNSTIKTFPLTSWIELVDYHWFRWTLTGVRFPFCAKTFINWTSLDWRLSRAGVISLHKTNTPISLLDF